MQITVSHGKKHCQHILLMIALVVACVFPVRLLGQSTALLTGTVVDPSGAVIPRAKVICRNTQTGLTHSVETGTAGLFRFPQLPIGIYEIAASHSGFATQTHRGITLVTGHSVNIVVKLQLGQTAQTVEVTAPVQEIQPTSSVLQTSLGRKSMNDLPLNGRNPLQLVFLTTGSIDLNGANGGSLSFQTANTQFSVDGNRGTDNNYELDGMSYRDPHFGTAPVLPNPDALQEFTVKSSNFSASQSGAGGSVQFATRSGTNQFHGSAFEFLRNDALDARNFFAAAPVPFKRNQFGGTLGGPIIKNRTFFFVSYQGTRTVGGATPSIGRPPTQALRQGVFPSTRTIYDPKTGLPFVGNVIPPSDVDPLATKLLSYIPLPNQSDDTYQSKPMTNQDDDQVLARFDHNLTSKDHLTGRYFFDKFGFQENTSAFTAFYGTDNYTNQSIMVSDTHTFSPDFLLVAGFDYAREPRNRAAVVPITMQKLGADVPLATPNAPPQTDVAINGYGSLLGGTPIAISPHTLEYRADFTWSHGKHMLQFGMDVIRNDEYAFDRSRESGTWSFDGSRTASPSDKNSGDPFADYLLGLPHLFSQHGASPQNIYETKWQPWIQDDWRILPNVTLNLGLRWEPWLPAKDRDGPQIGFEPGVQSVVAPNAPIGLVFSGDPGLQHSIFRDDWNNFAPRVGFAWDVGGNGKTVVRSAYGIFYRPEPLNLQRFSGNIATFRGLTINISDPSSFADPYAGYPGGTPFPWTPPTAAQLKTYPFTRPVATAALIPDSPTSYVQEWNFTVQRQVLRNTGLTLAYVGNHMVKGMSSTEGNPAIYGPGATEANVDARRPYTGIGSLQILSPFEFSNYNGLQATIKMHAQNGLTLLGNYVYSKCMDNNSDTFGGVSVINKFNPNLDYARCDFDRTQLANISVVYALPHVASLHGWTGKVVNGWQLSSIVTIESGGPFSVRSGVDNSRSGPTTNSGTNDLADQITADSSQPAGVNFMEKYFNTAAYVPNALGTFGDSGRNSLTDPGSWVWNFGLLKDIPITERVRTQFRFSAFNFLNHANFGGPVATLTNRNFGRILSADSPRVIQFALKLMF